jgi:hypothetical protein
LHRNSIDVSAKQLPFCSLCLFIFSGLGGGFAPRLCRRSLFRGFRKRFDI